MLEERQNEAHDWSVTVSRKSRNPRDFRTNLL